jgi:hypothetical protein
VCCKRKHVGQLIKIPVAGTRCFEGCVFFKRRLKTLKILLVGGWVLLYSPTFSWRLEVVADWKGLRRIQTLVLRFVVDS